MADGTPPGYTSDEKMPALDDGSHEDAADSGEDNIFQSVDPLDPRKVSLDIFEMYCHEMVNTPTIGRRAYLIIQMRVSYLLYYTCDLFFQTRLTIFWYPHDMT